MRLYLGLGGLPPFSPLARAASALAFDVDCPPLRPNSTAAGFLRGTLDSFRRAGVVFGVLRFAFFRVAAVARSIVAEVQTVDAGLPRGQGFAALVFLGNLFDGWEGVCHAPNIPNRLGSVNRAKWA